MHFIQTVAAAEFWHKWICLDKEFQFTVEFEHGDEHRSNKCIVGIRQERKTVSLVMSPPLVQDIQHERVSGNSS